MDNHALVRGFIEALNRHDTSALASLVADDVVYDDRFGTREIGIEQLQWSLGMDHLHFSEVIENIIVMTAEDGTHAAAQVTIRGTYQRNRDTLPAASGQPYSIPAGLFFEIDDGQISRITLYVNVVSWREGLEKALR